MSASVNEGYMVDTQCLMTVQSVSTMYKNVSLNGLFKYVLIPVTFMFSFLPVFALIFYCNTKQVSVIAEVNYRQNMRFFRFRATGADEAQAG